MISNTPLPISVPRINRCRGFYAYTPGGERYLDLFRENGTLVGGHRIKGAGSRFKNFLQKGAWGRYPGISRIRAEKSLLSSFQGYEAVSWFPRVEDALRALKDQCPDEAVCDPAGDESLTGSVGIWRALAPRGTYTWLLPWLPYTGSLLPSAVLGPRELDGGYSPPEYQVAILPMITSYSMEYARLDLGEYWKTFDHPLWKRRGPYISADIKEEEYGMLFDHFLKRKIILSPCMSEPSVLPDQLSSGDTQNFLKTSEEFYDRN